MKVTAKRLEASARIGAIRCDAIAAYIGAIRRDADAFRIACAHPRPVPRRAEPRPTQAARWAHANHSTLTRAAVVFGVTRVQVALAWERLGHPERVQVQ